MDHDSSPPMVSSKEIYQTKFDAGTYLGYCYQPAQSPEQSDNWRFVKFVLSHLSRTFSSGQYKGQRLIEVGTGPTLHTVLSACAHYQEIVLSDYTEVNRRELEKWLRSEEGHFDWGAHMQFVCELEGTRTPEEISATLRQRIGQVLACDVTLDNPFHPVVLEPADCVLSSLCLEAACPDRDSYRRSLAAVVGHLRPGGVLVLIGDLGENYYTVGEQRFPIVCLSRDFIEESLTRLGLVLLDFATQTAENREQNHKCDYEASFFLVARKNMGPA
ncbi:nicotinamide N-methyltransferase [Gadus morhua]|uniref:Nicotinamide N-methyltransferase n=1 Tax=Gadus morhua TaxID=8049 RepID=A0A8C5FGN6_GADMO|nr:nicotinamide N-methyltransferase-like [Gadus morhua]